MFIYLRRINLKKMFFDGLGQDMFFLLFELPPGAYKAAEKRIYSLAFYIGFREIERNKLLRPSPDNFVWNLIKSLLK